MTPSRHDQPLEPHRLPPEPLWLRLASSPRGVPADALLFEAHGLKVDNSLLTGESEPQLRTTALAAGARLDARKYAKRCR